MGHSREYSLSWGALRSPRPADRGPLPLSPTRRFKLRGFAVGAWSHVPRHEILLQNICFFLI